MDDKLKADLRKANTTPMNFVILPLGAKVVGMMVSKKPIKSVDARKLKKEKGAKKEIYGICAGVKEGMLFRCDAKDIPFEATKLKLFIKENTGLTMDPILEAAPGLAPLDESALDLTAERKQLVDRLTALTPQVSALIGKRPDLKTSLIAQLGEFKRMIQEISEDRPERVAHAKTKLAEIGAELKKYDASGSVDASAQPKTDDRKGKPKSADVDDKQRAALKAAFIKAVLNDDAAKWSDFHKYFSASSQKDLTVAFGGARGLTAIGKLLRDVCGGDPKRLRALSDAMD